MSTTTTGVYEVPQEHRDFLDGIRQVAQGVVAPRAADIDRTGEYPWDVRKAFAEADILALPFEEEHGGTGTGTLMLQMAVEEIAKASALDLPYPTASADVARELSRWLTPFEEVEISCAVDQEDSDRGQGVYRWVDVVEVPFVGGQRPVGMLEPLP